MHEGVTPQIAPSGSPLRHTAGIFVILQCDSCFTNSCEIAISQFSILNLIFHVGDFKGPTTRLSLQGFQITFSF